jgi:GH15 family glucan-1,4-alpha-glucosidase
LSLGTSLVFHTHSILTLCSHLAGYKDSAPVRIGNGAAFHQQFDIYGELMDAIYLYNKYGKPVTWEQWISIREILGTTTHFHMGISG